MRKRTVITPLGMNRDLAISKFDARFAYENKNLRLIADGETSQFVMTNERGPARIDVWFYKKLSGTWEAGDILGHVIGTAVIENHLVLFTTGKFKAVSPDTGEIVYLDRDRIYRIDFDTDAGDGHKVKGYELYKGSLGFDLNHPIETLPFYETEDIQKVYWTDGLNQPRMINIMAPTDSYTDLSFDFAQRISGHEKITVERLNNTNGLFPSGIVQYAFTYFRRYGQESSVASVTPLFFIADDKRGAAPDEIVACSFRIVAEGLSKDFDSIRIYSIVRTTKGGTPVVKRIAEMAITVGQEYVGGVYRDKPFGEVEYIDNNSTGEDVENAYLLYAGAKEITCETIAEKDNTAFYGNINVKHNHISDGLRAKLKAGSKTGGAFTQLGFRNNKEIAMPAVYGKYMWSSQLDRSSEAIRFFKHNETYRFGIQLQDRFGNWSDVVRIESDDENHSHDFFQGISPYGEVREAFKRGDDVLRRGATNLKNRFASFGGTLDVSLLEGLLDDYIAIRPVVVYPEAKDRNVLAQGLLTPAVYNLEDRVNNGTYAQMSWFSRPICSSAALCGPIVNIRQANQVTDLSILEFRHYRPLPPTNRSVDGNLGNQFTGSNAELVCNFESIKEGQNRKTIDYTFWANIYPLQERALYDRNNVARFDSYTRAIQLRSEFFVDQSVETLHSPDIEYTDAFAKIDMDNVKMRIVGIVPLTYNNEGVYMALEMATAKNFLHQPDRLVTLGGTYNTNRSYRQFTEFGGIQGDFENRFTAEEDISGPSTEGDTIDIIEEDKEYAISYWGTNKVYPFHTKTAAFEVEGVWPQDEQIRYSDYTSWFRPRPTATFAKKRYDSIRYSFDTLYFDEPKPIDIDKPSQFNTVDGGITNIEVDGSVKKFHFNVDKSVIPSTRVTNSEEARYVNGFIYPNTGEMSWYEKGNSETLYRVYGNTRMASSETVPLQYRSTSALALHLRSKAGGATGKIIQALPKYAYGASGSIRNWFNDVRDTTGTQRERTENIGWADGTATPLTERAIDMTGKRFLWDVQEQQYGGLGQEEIIDDMNVSRLICEGGYGFFYLAELYRDDSDVKARFGGESEEALAANVWTPCGAAVPLRDNNGDLLETVEIEWSEGDTYYQRYDNLHTYPNTEDDVNQIVDIVSFMCETRVNVDGRYDRNRGLEDNQNTRPTNSNILNHVYNQQQSYFQYRALDHERINEDNYPATVAWTKTKQLGEYTDVFTNVTLANTMDIDGSKGPLRALRKHFDSLLAFQDTGVCRILFNEREAVQTEAGVPLEIANSGKVTGKQYLSQSLGCHNKWSIGMSPTGTYFMDDAMKDIFHIGGDLSIKSVASEKGFRSWAREKADMAHVWGPGRWDCVRTLYDKNNCEMMFVSRDSALSFSEQLGQFTSFYDYEGTPFLESVRDHHVMLRSDGRRLGYDDLQPRTYLYEHNAGRYNYFFDRYRPYWTEFLCHSDGSGQDSPLHDKTWTNVSFQFDTFDDAASDVKARYKEEEHFDRVDCETEYQSGVSDWTGRYPAIKKTFRMWNADLPRDGYTLANQGHTTDRFRNPWLKMRLTKDKNLDKNWRSVLHSVTIGYLE